MDDKLVPQRIILISSTANSDSNLIFKTLKNLDWDNGKNYFFLETFPNACFSPNVFGKMSFGEAIFPKSNSSDLEKLRGNRDWHSVAREHVSAAFSGRNAQGGVH